MTSRGLLAIGILALQLAAPARALDDLAVGVKELLTTGLKPSASGLAAARTKYAALGRQPSFDARAKYAFALVLIEQRQLAEARRVLSEVLDERPEMLPAWQAKIWSDLVSRSFPAALDDMRAAARAVATADPEASGADRPEQRSLCGMLGRSVGFLQATKTGISAAKLKLGREEILAKMNADRTAFLASEQMIAAETAALEIKLGTIAEIEGAAADKQKDQQTDKKRAVSKATAEVDFQILKNQADAALQLKSLDWDLESLQMKVARLQFALNGIDLAIMAQYTQVQEAGVYALQADQAAASGRIVNSAQALRNGLSIQNGLANLQRLNALHLSLYNELTSLKGQLGAAVQARGGVVGESEESHAQLEAKERKLKHDEKKLEYAGKHARPSTAAGLGKHAMAEQKRSFSSFDPFPIEQEKERVLAWFED